MLMTNGNESVCIALACFDIEGDCGLQYSEH